MQDPATIQFVIREVTAARFTEINDAIGGEAVALNPMPTSDGQTVWCAQLAQPVKHWIEPADRDRYDPAYLTEDHTGTFVWTYFVTIHPHTNGAFGPGAVGVAAELAFIVDLTLSADAYFEPAKVEWAATVVVDVATSHAGHGDAEPSPPPADAAPGQDWPSSAPAEPPMPDFVESLPSRLPDRHGTVVTSQEFAAALDVAIAHVAALTGTPVANIPRPQEVAPRKHSRHRGDGPTYSIGAEIRYHTADLIEGVIWKSTTDPDEALYWILDDVTRSLAMAWARRTPAAATMDAHQLRWSVAVPLWHTLMTALDARWEDKTRDRIAEIRRHVQLGRPRQR